MRLIALFSQSFPVLLFFVLMIISVCMRIYKASRTTLEQREDKARTQALAPMHQQNLEPTQLQDYGNNGMSLPTHLQDTQTIAPSIEDTLETTSQPAFTPLDLRSMVIAQEILRRRPSAVVRPHNPHSIPPLSQQNS